MSGLTKSYSSVSFSVACILSPGAAELPHHPGEGGEGAYAAGGAALRCLQGEVATGSM